MAKNPRLPPAEDTPVPASPKVIVPLGRGAHGKTFWSRWAVERAQLQGRSVVVADVDRTNATLQRFFSDVKSPTLADDRTVLTWFETFSEGIIRNKSTTLLDLGGGDQLFKQMNILGSVVSLFEDNGIQVVGVYFLGPDPDDLAVLRDLEEEEKFAPAAKILVLNEALVPAERPLGSAFEPLMKLETFEEAVKGGAQPILMPRLPNANQVDERDLLFAAALEDQGTKGNPPISYWTKQMVKRWLDDMEKNFNTVTNLLP